MSAGAFLEVKIKKKRVRSPELTALPRDLAGLRGRRGGKGGESREEGKREEKENEDGKQERRGRGRVWPAASVRRSASVLFYDACPCRHEVLCVLLTEGVNNNNNNNV